MVTFIVCSSVARKIAEDEVVGAPTAVEMFTVFEKPVDGREAGEAVVFDRAGREQREGKGEVFEHDFEVLKGYLDFWDYCLPLR